MKTAVIGLQWGDEGKGKFVTYMSRFHDCVVRYSGGSNAGHTVTFPDYKIVHHLLPSADVFKGKRMYIGPGVAIDLEVLVKEIEEIDGIIQGARNLLRISKQAQIVTSFHKKLDAKIESRRIHRIGTTKKGIGPCYAGKALRTGLRLEDLEYPDMALDRLKESLLVWNEDDSIAEKMMEEMIKHYLKVEDLTVDSLSAVRSLRDKDLLFEGTQAVLLDIDAGTYPFVTSTNCSSTGIHAGFGFPVALDKILGVFKAYTTRVGEGPFPTEIYGDEAHELRQRGGEYGATTGRPRRCGWLDLPLLRYAIEISGCNGLAMTKADILSGIEKIPVCVAYKINGSLHECVEHLRNLEAVEPVYEYVDGWKLVESKQFEKFLLKIEKWLNASVNYISKGPYVEDITIR